MIELISFAWEESKPSGGFPREPLQTVEGTQDVKSDGLTESWKAGCMKTTLDLPEELVRQMKFQAVREGRKLRDVAEEIFRRGLGMPVPSKGGERRRVSLPIIPTPAGGRPFDLTGERLLELEMEAEARSPQV